MTSQDKTMHTVPITDFELRQQLQTVTFELLLQQIWSLEKILVIYLPKLKITQLGRKE